MAHKFSTVSITAIGSAGMRIVNALEAVYQCNNATRSSFDSYLNVRYSNIYHYRIRNFIYVQIWILPETKTIE